MLPVPKLEPPIVPEPLSEPLILLAPLPEPPPVPLMAALILLEPHWIN